MSGGCLRCCRRGAGLSCRPVGHGVYAFSSDRVKVGRNCFGYSLSLGLDLLDSSVGHPGNGGPRNCSLRAGGYLGSQPPNFGQDGTPKLIWSQVYR